jgi:hypothetical protein
MGAWHNFVSERAKLDAIDDDDQDPHQLHTTLAEGRQPRATNGVSEVAGIRSGVYHGPSAR